MNHAPCAERAAAVAAARAAGLTVTVDVPRYHERTSREPESREGDDRQRERKEPG